MMRVLLTADLHFNHPKSRAPAIELIDEINRAGGDVLVVVGDTAVADGDSLEQCLARFTFAGPKLFIAGNHEFWTRRDDSYAIYTTELPARVRALGWKWLESDPFVTDDIAIVGSVGWYDYSFAQASLGIPKRFYAAKVSPGAAEYLKQHADLFTESKDISPTAGTIVARWNDGSHVKLHRSDEAFVDELAARMDEELSALKHVPKIIAAVHHLPFRELLPPSHSAQWDFAKAYAGSAKLGEVLLKYPNITHLYCGHSHFAARARVGSIEAINIGSGYRLKKFERLDV